MEAPAAPSVGVDSSSSTGAVYPSTNLVPPLLSPHTNHIHHPLYNSNNHAGYNVIGGGNAAGDGNGNRRVVLDPSAAGGDGKQPTLVLDSATGNVVLPPPSTIGGGKARGRGLYFATSAGGGGQLVDDPMYTATNNELGGGILYQDDRATHLTGKPGPMCHSHTTTPLTLMYHTQYS